MKVQDQLCPFYGGGSVVVDSVFNIPPIGLLGLRVWSLLSYSPVENQNDLELDFKVFFFVDSCC